MTTALKRCSCGVRFRVTHACVAPIPSTPLLEAGNSLAEAVDRIRFMLYGLALLDPRQAMIAQKAIEEAVDAARKWREATEPGKMKFRTDKGRKR